ncbi:MAG: hypothetical protein AAFZ80_03855 [Cyanobacteria bacterium P01_A01_bin.105]
MNAYKVAATLTENGTLVLKGLPFHSGDTVEIIILEQATVEVPVTGDLTTATEIDAAFAEMATDTEYQAESLQIAQEFAVSQWEALPVDEASQ